MFIYDAALKTPYRILGINLPKDSLLHLSNLGLAAGETIEVVTKTKNSAIIKMCIRDRHLGELFQPHQGEWVNKGYGGPFRLIAQLRRNQHSLEEHRPI